MGKSRVEQQLQELEKVKVRGPLTDEEYAARRNAIISDTSLDAKSGRGGIFKWGALGCLGILGAIGAVFVAVIVIVVVAVGSSADTTEDSGGDVHVALAEGSSGEIAPQYAGSSRIKVTLLRAVDGADPNNPYLSPAPGMKYWAVETEVENVGTSEASSPNWKLRDITNLEYDQTYFSDVGENLATTYNLTPGGRLRGWVVFEVPVDAQPLWLRADPNVFAEYDLYFDAQS